MATLDEASLDPRERSVVEQLAEALRGRFGSRFVGLWLYGSRARGERRRDFSDVDLMVILEPATFEDQREAQRRALELAMAADLWDTEISVRVRDRAWLRERRAVAAFFVAELDRDRIVIAGQAA